MSARAMTALQRAGRGLLHRRLSALRDGRLIVRDALGDAAFGRPSPALPDPVTLEVRSPAFYTELLGQGTVGAAEAWIRGEWACGDLTALVRMMLRNEEAMGSLDAGPARLAERAARLAHGLRRNSLRGARRNIRAHYDLGNDFFSLVLDPSMTYSCAIFERPDATLQEASIAKYDRLCRRLGLGPGQRVLEIGTGWGGFAIHAASRYGCHVTTTTISREQHALARERVEKAGLADRVTLLLEDYRELRGRYDRLVSIEMIEAVGQQYLDTYFRVCTERLERDGAMGLQAITIREQRHDAALHEVDFIKKYVFPGGYLPSLGAICASSARAGDLQVREVVDLTPHYARTLREWRGNLHRRRDAITAAGYGEDFQRLWEYYMCYCEAAFRERNTTCQQILLARRGCALGSI